MDDHTNIEKRLPDFERARRYVLERLEKELSASLAYHSLSHTRDEVAPAVERIALAEGITGEELVIVCTAALFHDIGFVQQGQDHESVGAKIAAQVLPCFGYHPEQIERIQSLIMATKMPQSPKNLLEKVLADADLDVLGREDFLTRSLDLRMELEASTGPISDEEWFLRQMEFIRNHHYWTTSARRLRDSGKQRNLERLTELLNQRRVG